MKELTNTALTPHSERLAMTKCLHKPNVARQTKKAVSKEKPIPEGYVTLDEFMMNLLKEVRRRYEKKDNSH